MTDQNTQMIDDLRRITAQMIDELRATDVVPGIEVGEAAPDFTLPSATGEEVSLSDRVAQGPVVVVFYRGAWCPVCNPHMRSLQQILPDIESQGASLVAVNPQTPDDSISFAERLGLGFDVLSDVDQAVVRAYQLHFELPEELRDIYRQMGMALDEHNADGSWTLPVPATFIVDQHQVVRSRHVDADYRERMSPADVLEALRNLH